MKLNRAAVCKLAVLFPVGQAKEEVPSQLSGGNARRSGQHDFKVRW